MSLNYQQLLLHEPQPYSTSSSGGGATFGSGQGGLRSFASIPAVVLIKGQTVFSGSGHHLRVRLKLLGAAQSPWPVDPPGVCVGDVELPADRINRQVVPVRRIVAALMTVCLVNNVFCFLSDKNVFWAVPSVQLTLQMENSKQM